MKNIAKIMLGALLLLGMSVTVASADAKKGQILYLKKLKKVCGMNGALMAEKHTMAEWKSIYESGKLPAEIKGFCPNVKDTSLKQKYIEHYFDFLHKYAKDSGNIPAC